MGNQLFRKLKPRRAHRALFRHVPGALLALVVSLGAAADGFMFSTETEVPRIAGIAMGMVPDYMGSDDYQFGIAPYARYQFTGRNQFVQLLGPELSLNMLNSKNWRLGPVLNYRFTRDDEVDDRTVALMRKVDGTLEGGGFAEWFYATPGNPRQRYAIGGRLLADFGDAHDGMYGTISARMWQPVSPIIDLHFGAGMLFADKDFTRTYFGVNAADALATGLPVATADGGATDVRFNFGALMYLSRSWAATAGLQYRRLLGDAKDSPLVDRRGSANQFIGGVGVAYMW
jgi:outer membrane protein